MRRDDDGELFSYPADGEAQFVWRMLPGEDQASLTAVLHAIFATLHECDPRFDASLAWQAWRTAAALIQAAVMACVIFCPPGGGIHAADEWVELTGLEDFERIHTNVTRSCCT